MRPADVVAEDVPAPKCGAGSVLIANRHSLISAGTEGSAVKRNKRDMVVKTLKSAELRKTVKDMILNEGIGRTWDRVQFEMTKWTPLGYSGAGIAIEVGDRVDGISVGSPVAYAGEGHAEFIRAQKNLCVPNPSWRLNK